VTAFTDELEAFSAYADVYGDRSVFLIDTYDATQAVNRIIEAGLQPAAVRIDSGDLAVQSREIRGRLDAGGLSRTRIFVSGDLDEWSIAALVAAGAPIDGVGVGTALVTSKDAPALGGIYKLVEIERDEGYAPVMKLSGGKTSFPGQKQCWRHREGGRAVRDTLALASEDGPAGAQPLLQPVMKDGRRLAPVPALADIRRFHAAAVVELPGGLRGLDAAEQYPVIPSAALDRLTQETAARLQR
jgi:nicotinate phosphoribosyltransferase